MGHIHLIKFLLSGLPRGIRNLSSLPIVID